MDDYIKRQDVLDAIWLVDPQNDGSDGGTVVLQNLELTSADVESIVSEIPAADVCPVVRGRWIEKPYLLGTTNVCSVCGANYGMPHGKYNFCPNCGADMRGGDEL